MHSLSKIVFQIWRELLKETQENIAPGASKAGGRIVCGHSRVNSNGELETIYGHWGSAAQAEAPHAGFGVLASSLDDRYLRLFFCWTNTSKVLSDDGHEGHYGLRGMRERAKLLGGKLTVWSERDSGTKVELIIPAARAYTPSAGLGRSWFAERFFRK
jgi:hypothetical protein